MYLNLTTYYQLTGMLTASIHRSLPLVNLSFLPSSFFLSRLKPNLYYCSHIFIDVVWAIGK